MGVAPSTGTEARGVAAGPCEHKIRRPLLVAAGIWWRLSQFGEWVVCTWRIRTRCLVLQLLSNLPTPTQSTY
ncbi:unnamed protein product, partial [Clonostachys solani]